MDRDELPWKVIGRGSRERLKCSQHYSLNIGSFETQTKPEKWTQ
jgi:hypothetical protein